MKARPEQLHIQKLQELAAYHHCCAAGPSKLVVNNVVLLNFSLSNPTKPINPVLWPAGLLQQGWQAGTTLPRKLYLLDVRIFVQAESLQLYLQFFRYKSSAMFYTVSCLYCHMGQLCRSALNMLDEAML
jgi:hypothetical protein